MAAQVADMAAREGLSTVSYVRTAVAVFASMASEADWATLTSSMRDDGDPGTVCLLAMIHWRLSAPDCGCHAAERTEHHERTPG